MLTVTAMWAFVFILLIFLERHSLVKTQLNKVTKVQNHIFNFFFLFVCQCSIKSMWPILCLWKRNIDIWGKIFKNVIRSANMLHVKIMAAEIPPLGPDSDIQCSSSYCNALLCTRKQTGNSKHRKKARKKYLMGFQHLSSLMNKL